MSSNVVALLVEARRHLGVSQGSLGEKLGSSNRTGQRWERGGSPPTAKQLHQLAVLVHSLDPDLARRIASAGGTSLEQLGLASPASAASALAPHPEHIVDTVVCAAAEAMQVMPDAIRPALRAAFRRAKLAGLSVDAVDGALNAAGSADKIAATGGKKKTS